MDSVPKRYVNVKTSEELIYLLEELRHGTFKYLAFDTETTGLGRSDSVFGFSVTLGHSDNQEQCGKTYWYRFSEYVIGATSEDIESLKLLDQLALDVLTEIFSTGKRVIMHHAAFDIRLVRQSFGIQFTGEHLNDTMLMSECLRITTFNGLKPLAAHLLKRSTSESATIDKWFRDHKVKKSDRDFSELPDEIMFPYACADTEMTYALFWKLREQFALLPAAVQQIYKLERAIVTAVADMEYNGMEVSLEYFTKLRDTAETEAAKLRERLPVENPNSPQQVAKWLFGKDGLGLTPTSYTEAGHPKTDAKTLEKYAGNPAVAGYIQYNKLTHLLKTFINGVLENAVKHEDGTTTIHTSYDQIIHTGRFSSNSINLQNIPNDSFSRGAKSDFSFSIRKGFVCPVNYLYIKLDYSAFELRLIGNASGDPNFIAMVLDGIDMHSWLAMKLYSDDLDRLNNEMDGRLKRQFDTGHAELNEKWGLTWRYWAIKSKSTPELKYMRTMVKICSFQIYYGSGPRTISNMHGIPEGEAARLRDICFTSFKRVAQWRNEVVSRGSLERCVYTMFGRKCVVDPNKAYTAAVNYTIQGTAADILKLAMREIAKRLRGKRTKLVATIHDELQLYVHKDELDLIPEFIKCMEWPFLPPEKAPLPMLAELSCTADNWSDMVDIDHTKDGWIDKIKEMTHGSK